MDARDNNGPDNTNLFTDPVTRRRFLAASTVGLAAYSFFLPSLADAKKRKKKRKKIKPTATAQATPTPEEPPTLRELATQRHLLVGSAVIADNINTDYGQLVAKQFNAAICAEVFMDTTREWYKTTALRPSPTTYDFSRLDNVMQWARDRNMVVMPDTLIAGTYDYLPDWLVKGTFSRSEYVQILTDEVKTVITHLTEKYPDVQTQIGVVLEPIPAEWGGAPGRDFWMDTIGPDYIADAFTAAVQANPKGYYVLDGAPFDTVSPYYVALAQQLHSTVVDGRPILDALGVQAFAHADTMPSAEQITGVLRTYRGTGVDVISTGSSVAIPDYSADSLTMQAEGYRRLIDAFLVSGVSDSFYIYGLDDSGPDIYPAGSKGAPFDESKQPKPAFQAIVDEVQKVASQ